MNKSDILKIMELCQSFFYRSDVNIRDRFGPMNIGANSFCTGPLSLNLSFQQEEEIEFSQDAQDTQEEEEEEEHDLLSSAISEGNFSLHS